MIHHPTTSNNYEAGTRHGRRRRYLQVPPGTLHAEENASFVIETFPLSVLIHALKSMKMLQQHSLTLPGPALPSLSGVWPGECVKSMQLK